MFSKRVKVNFSVFLYMSMMTGVVKEFDVCPSLYKP